LKEKKLCAKFENCKFGVMKVDFLGHKITQKGLKMDDHKVKAILDWEPPRLVLALISFLKLASYYRKFIKNLTKIATPLTNLLKKSFGTYKWDETCNKAFETLKGILVKVHVLKLSDFDKDYEIHSDASDFAIKGILMQGGTWWLPPSPGHTESCKSEFVTGSSYHQMCSSYALTNLFFGLCRSV
jgi:hypothetical protein